MYKVAWFYGKDKQIHRIHHVEMLSV